MELSNQTQKAGDNAQQIQAGTINIYNGITEERAREICTEVAKKAIEDFSVIAYNTANDRIQDFENELIPRLEKTEHGLEAFSEPAFQILLKKAQIAAACSERECDYKILSELLVHRVKNKSNVKKKASIAKAVEIIDQIDDDSLCGLTVFYILKSLSVVAGSIDDILSKLSSFYAKFDLEKLPNDDLWIDNLTILGTITVPQFIQLPKFDDIIYSKIPVGYACAGIKKDSVVYYDAIDLLGNSGLNEKTVFIDNELLDGYVRIRIKCKNDIDDMGVIRVFKDGNLEIVPLNEVQKETLKNVFNMYDNNKEILSIVRTNFSKLLDNYPAMKKLKLWWDSLHNEMLLTSVGRVIAYTYAKSVDSTLPDLD